MNDLLLLINKDIRQGLKNPPLSTLNLLLETQVDELDEGAETEHWFTDELKGIQIKCDSLFIVKTIFLFSGKSNRELFLPYPGRLIDDLSFEDSKDNVRNALGTPSISREAFDSKFFGISNGFDRYDFDRWSIHFSYSVADERIELITIMSPDKVPLLPQ